MPSPQKRLLLGSTTPRAPIAATRSFSTQRLRSLFSSRPVAHALRAPAGAPGALAGAPAGAVALCWPLGVREGRGREAPLARRRHLLQHKERVVVVRKT